MSESKVNSKKKIVIAVVSVLLVLIIAGGVYCVATKQSPVAAVQSMFTANDEKIIGKWQSQTNPGLSAYVFYDDGSYDSYLSTANFSGKYYINGSELTLINPNTSKEIVYKIKVTDKVLTLNLIEEDGKKPEEDEESKYDRVDELNQKSLADLIGELKENNESTTAEEK